MIFDAHAHNVQMAISKEETNWWDKPAVDYTEKLMKHMAANGVQKAVLGVSHAPNENEMIQAAVRKFPDTFLGLCGWGIQKKLTGQQAAEVCDRWLQEPEFVGVGEVLFYSLNATKGWETTVQDWWREMRPVLDVVKARNGVVLFHTGFSGAHSGKSATPLLWKDPLLLDQIASEYWDVPMIIGHSGGQYAPYDQHALVVAYNHDNCYLETSKSRTDVIETAVKEIGSSRILFGSDWTHGEPMPIGPVSERPAHLYDWNIANVTRAKISDADKENILYNNAAALFKLSKAATA